MRYHNWLYIGLILVASCSESKGDRSSEIEQIREAVSQEIDASIPVPAKQELDYSQFPKRSQPYLHLITGENPSWFAGLVDTESRYNQFAVSPRGAIGLTQIMPSNHEWLENGMCSHLGRAKPEDPAWQMACGQKLFEWGAKWNKNPPPLNYCDMQYIKSLLFNGGYYIWWEFNYGGQTLSGAKNICGTLLPNGRKRSEGSCDENYKYAMTISKKQKLFTDLGGTQCIADY